MTYYVPNTGQGLLLGNHNPGLSYTTVHKPDCRFLPEGTVPFDGVVAVEGESRVRRDIRVGRIASCHFCQPVALIEGKPPHERHAQAIAQDDALCTCGHKYVTHALSGGGCYHTHLDDYREEVRCECTKFVAAEEGVKVVSEPMQAPNPGDVIAPGAFVPGTVDVVLPDGRRVEGDVDADGRVSVVLPPHVLRRTVGGFSIGSPS
jgi:hypothetical protein